jgi:hypothetical protein
LASINQIGIFLLSPDNEIQNTTLAFKSQKIIILVDFLLKLIDRELILLLCIQRFEWNIVMTVPFQIIVSIAIDCLYVYLITKS